MNTKTMLIATLLAATFAPAATHAAPMQLSASAVDGGGAGADQGSASDEPRIVRHERVVINGEEIDSGDAGHGHFGGALMQMHGRAVKGAPYSAEIISEQQQTLADGNQIVNKSSSMSYRDSAGRTRQETRDASGAVRVVTINDSVQGITYILHPEQKTATKIGPRGDLERAARNQAREALRREGGERVIIKRVERELDGPARQRIHENVRIQVEKNLAGRPAMERIGPMIAGAFGDMKWASKATVKDLGTRDIEGIKAQGKSKSYEIPAGEIGNRNPIVVASESWYAPELQVTLMTRRSDPRTGERSWRMAAIKRDEPAAALFAVPSDYTVKDVLSQVRKVEKIDKK